MGLIIEASAPGRCGIVGNPSDIYGGMVLSCSIPARNTCRLVESDVWKPLPDNRLWDAIQKRFPVSGFSVEYRSDVPRSSGLSGSTSLLAATLACVLTARGERPNFETVEERSTFAELVRSVERYDADIVCGFQDAYMIVHGGLQLMSFPGKHPVNPGPHATLERLKAELPFLLVTTGVERLSGSVHGPMAQRWLDGDSEVRSTMERLPYLAEQGAYALRNHDWERLGELMDENHSRIASLGGSGEAIDALIADCKAEGALGAKLAGAGLGGTVIALTRDVEALQIALAARGYSRFMKPEIATGVRFEG